MPKRILAISALLVLALFGCQDSENGTPTSVILGDSAKMSLRLEVPTNLNIDTGEITITKGDLEHSQSVDLQDGSATVVFEDIQPGIWQIHVALYDADGFMLYEGSGEAEVHGGETNSAHIVLTELSGDLEVIITIPSHGFSIEPSDFSPDAITLDFDDLPTGPLTDEYAHLGVIFENTDVISRDYAPSVPNEIRPIDWNFPMYAIFVDPTSLEPATTTRVGMFIDLDAMHGPRPMISYDSEGNEIGSVPFEEPGDFAGIEYLDGIARVEFGPTDGYDNFMFEPVGVPAHKIYWSTSGDGTISRANMDGTEVENVLTVPGEVGSLDFDEVDRKIYWIRHDYPHTIHRANEDGTNIEDLVTSGIDVPRNLDVDEVGRKLYWTDRSAGTIQRADLDGSNVVTIIPDAHLAQGIRVEPVDGKIYWSQEGVVQPPGYIRRANLDGTEIETLVSIPMDPEVIAVDKSIGKIYWTGNSMIRRANLDGSHIEVVATGWSGPWGIDLDPSGQQVYYVLRDEYKIQRMNLDGSGTVDLVTGLSSPYGVSLDLTSAE